MLVEEPNVAKGDVEEFANAAKPEALNADAEVWVSLGEASSFRELNGCSADDLGARDANGEIVDVLLKGGDL